MKENKDTMTSVKNVWNAKAEAIMMGITQPVTSTAEAEYIIDYITHVMGEDITGAEMIKQATRYCKVWEIKYLNTCIIEGMPMIAILMSTDEDEEPFNILSRNGVFGYVYNFDCPDCSELGYSFYSNETGRIRRIG